MKEDDLYKMYLDEASTALWADMTMIVTLQTINECRIDIYDSKSESTISKIKKADIDQQIRRGRRRRGKSKHRKSQTWTQNTLVNGSIKNY